MDRRKFLKSLGLLGASGMAFSMLPKRGKAAEPYEGQLLFTINAVGGWDITNFCDPKGGEMNRRYETSEIRSAGVFNYAPIDTNQAFFERFSSEMLLINGIDMRTAGHTEAARHLWSGEPADNNTPSIAALFAARHMQGIESPSPFISAGGFSRTGDLVPLTRLGSPLTLSSIALHEHERGIANQARYAEDFALEEIYQAREARHGLASGSELPRIQKQRSELFGVQTTVPLLRRYQEFLPSAGSNPNGNPWFGSVANALACLRAGICAGASVYVSDFDTHSDHENRHAVKLQELLEVIHYAYDRAEELGLLDRITFLISSEFARTPNYNSNGGKDHWPANSMILMGPGIAGNRVIGATDAELVPQKVNFESVELDESGERIYPGHIHSALREHFDLQDFGVEAGFDLRMPALPIFS